MIKILVALVIVQVSANWQLVVQDDFDGDKLDQDKWTIANENTCQGEKWGMKSCSIATDKNLRLVNGTLAIGAIRQKYQDYDYISPRVGHLRSLKLAKFEVRTTMPIGKMLHGAYMVRSIESHEPWFPKMMTFIFTNSETNEIVEGFKNSASKEEQVPIDLVNHHHADFDISQFNIYTVVVTPTLVTYSINNKNYYQVNVTEFLAQHPGKLYNPAFFGFSILVSINFYNRLGGEDLTVEDVRQWNCSLMVVDWIRLYQWNDSHTTDDSKVGDENGSLSSLPDSYGRDICHQIMPELRPLAQIEDSFSFGGIYFYSMLTVLVLFFLLMIVASCKSLSKKLHVNS